MATKTSKTLYYVTRRRFSPRFTNWQDSQTNIRIQRGCVLRVHPGTPFETVGSGGLGHRDPARLSLLGGIEVIDTFQTFRNNGGFSHHVWGPFDEGTLNDGIWYVRGTFGQDGHADVSILHAGRIITYCMEDDATKRNLICPELFDALVGEKCLTISQGDKFSLLAPMEPHMFLVHD